MQVSIYHNVLVTSSNSSKFICLWDYEYIKLLSCLEIERGEVNCMQFINGYSILIVGTNNGMVYLVQFKVISEICIEYNILAVIDVAGRKTY